MLAVMEEDSPYRASQVVLVTPTDAGGMQVPKHITRPITQLWILLCIQIGFVVVEGLNQAINSSLPSFIPMAIIGISLAINAAFAIGVYMRALWVAIIVAVLNGGSLLAGLYSFATADGSIVQLLIWAVLTLVSVRGVIAIRAYRRFVENWWRGKA